MVMDAVIRLFQYIFSPYITMYLVIKANLKHTSYYCTVICITQFYFSAEKFYVHIVLHRIIHYKSQEKKTQ